MEENQQQDKVSPGFLWTFIIVVIAGVGYFGWYFWNQSQTAPAPVDTFVPVVRTTSPTPSISSSISPSISSSPISTADWKTYTNDKYKYSIKYPAAWIVTPEKNASGEDRVYISEKQMSNGYQYDSLDIDLALYPSETKNTYIESAMNNAKEKITVSGVNGMIEYEHNGDDSAPVVGSIITLQKDSYIYVLWSDYLHNSSNKQILDKMISTFQFTDATTSTTTTSDTDFVLKACNSQTPSATCTVDGNYAYGKNYIGSAQQSYWYAKKISDGVWQIVANNLKDPVPPCSATVGFPKTIVANCSK